MATDVGEQAAKITANNIEPKDGYDLLTEEQLKAYPSYESKANHKLVDILTQLQSGLSYFSTFIPLERVNQIISLSHKVAVENLMLRQKLDELIFKTLKESIRRNISLPNNGYLGVNAMPHMRPDK